MNADDWQTEAVALMREGYGVEDVAVKLREWGFNTTLPEVRALAGRLREIGALDGIYRRQK